MKEKCLLCNNLKEIFARGLCSACYQKERKNNNLDKYEKQNCGDKEILKGIYLIKNKLDNKVYVGKSQNILYRWHTHKVYLKNNKHKNLHLQNAWNKYGENNFEFVILEIIENYNQQISSKRERFYIKEFDSYKEEKGYNKTKGGDGAGKVGYLTYEQEETALQLIKNNMSYRKLSEMFGIPESVFGRLADKNGIYRCPRMTKVEIREIIRYIKKGYKTKDIISMTGRSQETIDKIKRDLGLNAKVLDDNEIAKIKDLLLNSELKQIEIAKIFGVTHYPIYSIKMKLVEEGLIKHKGIISKNIENLIREDIQGGLERKYIANKYKVSYSIVGYIERKMNKEGFLSKKSTELINKTTNIKNLLNSGKNHREISEILNVPYSNVGYISRKLIENKEVIIENKNNNKEYVRDLIISQFTNQQIIDKLSVTNNYINNIKKELRQEGLLPPKSKKIKVPNETEQKIRKLLSEETIYEKDIAKLFNLTRDKIHYIKTKMKNEGYQFKLKGRSKLSEEYKAEIKQMLKDKALTQNEIAKKYNVSRSAILSISLRIKKQEECT